MHLIPSVTRAPRYLRKGLWYDFALDVAITPSCGQTVWLLRLISVTFAFFLRTWTFTTDYAKCVFWCRCNTLQTTPNKREIFCGNCDFDDTWTLARENISWESYLAKGPSQICHWKKYRRNNNHFETINNNCISIWWRTWYYPHVFVSIQLLSVCLAKHRPCHVTVKPTDYYPCI